MGKMSTENGCRENSPVEVGGWWLALPPLKFWVAESGPWGQRLPWASLFPGGVTVGARSVCEDGCQEYRALELGMEVESE